LEIFWPIQTLYTFYIFLCFKCSKVVCD
jgi:hypothetical protein